MLLSNFGRFIRKYRIDHNITLKEMADKIGISSAFLSAIETGRKSFPDSLENKILENFTFSQNEKEDLQASIDSSRNSITKEVGNEPLDQMIMGAFCRNYDTLDNETKSKILTLLKGEKFE